MDVREEIERVHSRWRGWWSVVKKYQTPCAAVREGPATLAPSTTPCCSNGSGLLEDDTLHTPAGLTKAGHRVVDLPELCSTEYAGCPTTHAGQKLFEDGCERAWPLGVVSCAGGSARETEKAKADSVVE